jgi:hypothetical protein
VDKEDWTTVQKKKADEREAASHGSRPGRGRADSKRGGADDRVEWSQAYCKGGTHGCCMPCAKQAA